MISFAKYHGAGNDFIVIDDRNLSFPTHSVASLCHRSLGIGADGVVLLQPSTLADFKMRIFNADGSEPTMCGNGICCLNAFIRHRKISEKDSLQIETGAGILECRFLGERIGVNLKAPRIQARHLDVQPLGVNTPATIDVLNTGVPHGVMFVPDVETIDLQSLGRLVRFHKTFAPDGINVNVASVSSDKTVRIRTYERGVEGETLSCGTGAAATAWIAADLFSLPNPITVLTQSGLPIEVNVLGSEKSIELLGKPTLVFEGQIPILYK